MKAKELSECARCKCSLVCVLRVAAEAQGQQARQPCAFFVSDELTANTFDQLVTALIVTVAHRHGLTSIETDVLRSLLLGDGYPDIARDRGITVHTVRFHVGRLYEKLYAESRNDLWRVLRTFPPEIAPATEEDTATQ
jgi:DNA-binding CsgD family transcriptional regulator